MSARAASPFSPRIVLAMVLFGAAVFVLLLWMIGSGMTSGDANDGGGHVGGKGLNGYAALAELLEKQGYTVERSRSEAALDKQSLLVLTPPAFADGEQLNTIIERRRYMGPTLLVLPKWGASAVPASLAPKGTKKGWVMLGGEMGPIWADDLPQAHGDLDARVDELKGAAARWSGLGHDGKLPDPRLVQSITNGGLQPLVRDGKGQVLAAYVDDGGYYPDLADAAGADYGEGEDENEDKYPLVIVAEPDLLDNYGMADRSRAMLALELFRIIDGGEEFAVSFDMTQNGLGRSANLLTLAFTPPFLAGTLCLILAALALGWRAFNRFGPARLGARAIAFGKRALVANAAGLVIRSRRLHLVSAPFADAARERLAHALALPRHADAAATEAAIDRALASRDPTATPFSVRAAAMRAARGAHAMLRAAQDLHALERTLKR